jgi:DHA3 family tetracycline resistance protein-like MFS transporter
LVDAATFGASALCLLAVRSRDLPREFSERLSARAELREGAAYVRSQPWIWGTLVTAGLSLLFWFGPSQVLLPYIVKNELGGGAADLGAVYAAAGIGSLIGALAWGQLGLPRRPILVMALAWVAPGLELAALGIVGSLWQAAAALAIGHALAVPGMIIWMTLLQSEVPPGMLGRVSSFDWLVSTCLLPISFALTGPVAAAAGADATVIAGGLISAGVMAGLLAIPGVREIERHRAQTG